MEISSQPVAVAVDVVAPGCSAGCSPGTLCLSGVCTCAVTGNQSASCQDLDYCLADADCASGSCMRFRGSLTLKVCAKMEHTRIVDAAVALSGVSADTFSATDRAAFVAAMTGFLPATLDDTASCTLTGTSDFGVTPGTCVAIDAAVTTCTYVAGAYSDSDGDGSPDTADSADSCTSRAAALSVVILEVTSQAATPESGRRMLQNAEGQVDGGAESVGTAALIRFHIVGSDTAAVATSVEGAVTQNVDALATALETAGVGTDPETAYAVQASMHSVSTGTAYTDCQGMVDGPAVHDPCGVCFGDGTSCHDCAAVPNGGAALDACSVCGGDGICASAGCTFEALMASFRDDAAPGENAAMMAACRAVVASVRGSLTVKSSCSSASGSSVSCDMASLLDHPAPADGFLGPCMEVAEAINGACSGP